jgi:transposase
VLLTLNLPLLLSDNLMTPSSVNSLSSTAFQLLSFVSQAARLPEIANPQRKPYPSELSDAAWAILNAIFYVQRTGWQWEMMPPDLPPDSTVSGYFKKWQRKGVWQRMHDAIRHKLRKNSVAQQTLRWFSQHPNL